MEMLENAIKKSGDGLRVCRFLRDLFMEVFGNCW